MVGYFLDFHLSRSKALLLSLAPGMDSLRDINLSDLSLFWNPYPQGDDTGGGLAGNPGEGIPYYVVWSDIDTGLGFNLPGFKFPSIHNSFASIFLSLFWGLIKLILLFTEGVIKAVLDPGKMLKDASDMVLPLVKWINSTLHPELISLTCVVFVSVIAGYKLHKGIHSSEALQKVYYSVFYVVAVTILMSSVFGIISFFFSLALVFIGMMSDTDLAFGDYLCSVFNNIVGQSVNFGKVFHGCDGAYSDALRQNNNTDRYDTFVKECQGAGDFLQNNYPTGYHIGVAVLGLVITLVFFALAVFAWWYITGDGLMLGVNASFLSLIFAVSILGGKSIVYVMKFFVRILARFIMVVGSYLGLMLGFSVGLRIVESKLTDFSFGNAVALIVFGFLLAGLGFGLKEGHKRYSDLLAILTDLVERSGLQAALVSASPYERFNHIGFAVDGFNDLAERVVASGAFRKGSEMMDRVADSRVGRFVARGVDVGRDVLYGDSEVVRAAVSVPYGVGKRFGGFVVDKTVGRFLGGVRDSVGLVELVEGLSGGVTDGQVEGLSGGVTDGQVEGGVSVAAVDGRVRGGQVEGGVSVAGGRVSEDTRVGKTVVHKITDQVMRDSEVRGVEGVPEGLKSMSVEDVVLGVKPAVGSVGLSGGLDRVVSEVGLVNRGLEDQVVSVVLPDVFGIDAGKDVGVGGDCVSAGELLGKLHQVGSTGVGAPGLYAHPVSGELRYVHSPVGLDNDLGLGLVTGEGGVPGWVAIDSPNGLEKLNNVRLMLGLGRFSAGGRVDFSVDRSGGGVRVVDGLELVAGRDVVEWT